MMAGFQVNRNDSINSKKVLFIFTRTPWSEPERARHQVAKALASYSRVVFIEANKVGLPRIELKEISENLQLLTPFWPIDYRIRSRMPSSA